MNETLRLIANLRAARERIKELEETEDRAAAIGSVAVARYGEGFWVVKTTGAAHGKGVLTTHNVVEVEREVRAFLLRSLAQ